jgi:hypothetical protein
MRTNFHERQQTRERLTLERTDVLGAERGVAGAGHVYLLHGINGQPLSAVRMSDNHLDKFCSMVPFKVVRLRPHCSCGRRIKMQESDVPVESITSKSEANKCIVSAPSVPVSSCRAGVGNPWSPPLFAAPGSHLRMRRGHASRVRLRSTHMWFRWA